MRFSTPLRCAAALAVAGMLALTPFAVRCAEDDPKAAQAPATKPTAYLAPASDEGVNAIKQFSLPKGWEAELFAAEPRLANPTALSIDDRGRVYVVETFRRRNAVLDIRKIPDWLDDDLALRTVQQRIDLVKRRMPDTWQNLIGLTDRIRLIEDSDGDGVADKDTVFATGFDQLEEGTAAGVLPFNGSVYFANVPNLWKLKDTNDDGVADQRESMYFGFGVRYAYSGHDFHGLIMGPDGRLYFSMADRGVHIEKDGKVLIDNPDSGCVMRCDPDGGNLEMVHTGLRNPQELAFDEYGNLFTADNNSDGGDPSRWVYVVEGGDSGWHVGWQWLTSPVSRGPWMSEDITQVNPRVPAYYRLPPIATPKIAGPAGLTYTPGTGMPEDWQNRFLLVDFRGGPSGGSGVYALKNKPMGASFELEEVKELITGVLPTDVTFGPDSRIYFTDWVSGWEPHGKGRIYAITPPGQDAAKVAEVKKLLAEGFDGRNEPELSALLAHADMRVRQKAQFELAGRLTKGQHALQAVAEKNDSQLARIHAIWGLGQIARQARGDSPAAATLVALLRDGDAEIRAQAAKMLGDARSPSAVDPLINIVKRDRNVRTQAFAVAALGQLQSKAAVDPILALLKKHNDRDAYLRHAGVMALLGINDADALAKASDDSSSAIRIAALLVYRRQHSPQVAKFLQDIDPTLILEAARAINDDTLTEAMPQLAALTTATELTEPIYYRALNANYRLGSEANARALAAFAARADVPTPTRVEALKMLSAWKNPSGRDRVTGLWRPVPARGDDAAKTALGEVLDGVLADAPDAVRIAALNASTALEINTKPLIDLVKNEKNPPGLRAAAIAAMATRKDKKLPEAAKIGLASPDPQLRLAAIRVQPSVAGGVQTLTDVLASGTPAEQQAVVQTAAALMSGKDEAVGEPDKPGERLLRSAFDRLTAGTLPVEAQLDLLTAAATKKSGKLADAYKAYEAARKQQLDADPLALHRETLLGGDAEKGAYIFRERADVSCLRCHAIDKTGGNAGPDLAGLTARITASTGGGDKAREHILESILYPSKKIAEGWETVAIRTNDGDLIAGVIKSEDANEVTLEVPAVGPVKVPKANIKSRQGGLSGMPDDISKTLSKEDIRDLVEYLARQ